MGLPLKGNNSMMMIKSHEDMLYNKNAKTITDAEEQTSFEVFSAVIAPHCGDFGRPICIDPIFGSYGHTGYVFTVQGTPTKGMAIIDLDRKTLWVIPVNGGRIKTYSHFENRKFYDLALNILNIASLSTLGNREEPEHAIIGLPDSETENE